jgi:hypothetical protein
MKMCLGLGSSEQLVIVPGRLLDRVVLLTVGPFQRGPISLTRSSMTVRLSPPLVS